MQCSKWIAVTMLLAVPAFADRYENELRSKTTYHGGRVTIEHSMGKIEVHTTRGSDIDVRGIVRSSDESLGKQIRFAVSEGAQGVTIRTVYPEVHRVFGNLSWSADLEVSIPENAPLSLKNRFGTIEVRGLRADAEINNAQGPVTVHDIRAARVDNAFGTVTVDTVGGDLTVQNANGSVQVDHARGNVTVTDRFGSVRVSDASRDVVINDTNGSVDLSNVGGNTRITTSFASINASKIDGNAVLITQGGRVEASDIKGSADIRNSFGGVRVINVGRDLSVESSSGRIEAVTVGGNATIRGSFGAVDLRNVNGSADVINASGSVTAEKIGGNAHVHTTFGSVFLEGVGGAVSVENQNGAIGVSGLRAPCHDITLKTSFSPIKVAVSAGAGYSVNARTSFGSINADVPFTVTRKSENSLQGTIASGGCRMELESSNGGISITRE